MHYGIADTYGDPMVNLDDLRLAACIWRQSHGYRHNAVCRQLGLSNTWLSSFERGYGTAERPYSGNLLKLLALMGYPAGLARSMTREVYPEVSHPTYWYMEHATDFAVRETLLAHGLGEDLVDSLMEDIEFDDFVRYGPERLLERTLPARDGCPYAGGAGTAIRGMPEHVRRTRCARCRDNHQCGMSAVSRYGSGVGRILSEAHSDHSVEFEECRDAASGETRYRIVTHRFRRVVDDNFGRGYAGLKRDEEQQLLEQAKAKAFPVGGTEQDDPA